MAIKPFLNDLIHWHGADGTQNNLWNFSRAVENTKSKYVMVLHDDDRLLPDFLKMQLEYLENYPEVLALSANGLIINENGERIGDYVINENKELFYFDDELSVVNHSLISCIPMSPVIYKSEIFDSIRLNTKFGKCCDTGLFLDIIKQGPIIINNAPIYECRVHSSQDSTFFPLNDFKSIFEVFDAITINHTVNCINSERVYKKFTNIALSRIYNAFIRKNRGYNLFKEVNIIFDHKFKFRFVYDFLKSRLKRI
jgi:hypothetical protein